MFACFTLLFLVFYGLMLLSRSAFFFCLLVAFCLSLFEFMLLSISAFLLLFFSTRQLTPSCHRGGEPGLGSPGPPSGGWARARLRGSDLLGLMSGRKQKESVGECYDARRALLHRRYCSCPRALRTPTGTLSRHRLMSKERYFAHSSLRGRAKRTAVPPHE